ncbi:Sec-independent protein translocase protein TatB [Lichenihabitans sp. Uapishka_5]|uniref:Sec-independent protein translocase protein TatB n=1 Tax=Lichenihabitans sp. Uapishka_5 TaxID=3037302 RepID=UPI0029E8097C|nr:Sec-independent protein translocase protein TatB [Lichenihabitans sp. Uapishka_5]MDX7950363.1 Sec-independent protein translocase protein TatB [Lichenihabitans sp. Uapishka_5]
MFDIDTSKLLIVAVLALIVIGPKELPRVMRQIGQAVGKLRRMSAEFQGQFMDAIKDAEIEDIRRELKDLEKTSHFNPVADIQAEVSSLKTTVESAIGSVDTDAAVVSPASHFDLPAVPEAMLAEAEADAAAEPTLLAEGIAPVAGEDTPVATPAPLDDRRKRKLFVKPHRSRFARMNSERTADLTGQAIATRQRLVRARRTMPHEALSR